MPNSQNVSFQDARSLRHLFHGTTRIHFLPNDDRSLEANKPYLFIIIHAEQILKQNPQESMIALIHRTCRYGPFHTEHDQ
jgi:hypothetical protein